MIKERAKALEEDHVSPQNHERKGLECDLSGSSTTFCRRPPYLMLSTPWRTKIRP